MPPHEQVSAIATQEVRHEFLIIDTKELDPSSFSKLRETIKDSENYKPRDGQGMRNGGEYVAVYNGDQNTWEPLFTLMKELKAVGVKTDPSKWRIPRTTKWRLKITAYPKV